MNRHRCWVSRSVTHTLCHFFFGHSLAAATASYSPSSFCAFPFFWWVLKRKTSSSSKYVRAQGVSQRSLRLPVLSVPYGSPFPPHSLIEDFSMCHPAFSLPGLVDANVAEISGFPLTPLQSLQESFTQTKQQQAAGSHSSPEYGKTCSGITHVCNPVCLHACTCMFCIWYSVYISVCVRRSAGRPDRF